jgi:hypothetical protein
MQGNAHVVQVSPPMGPAGQASFCALPMIVAATFAGVGCAVSGYADLQRFVTRSSASPWHFVWRRTGGNSRHA